MANLRNNCRNTVRCDGCTLELLGEASDRVQAGFVVASVLHYAEAVDGLTSRELAAVSSTELLDRVRAVRPEFSEDITHLVGTVVGAIALTANDQCNIAHKVD